MGSKNCSVQRLVWFENFGTIPDGWIVHHINGNKKDNRIENLACMDFVLHNRIHAHDAWNKGIKAPQISAGKKGHLVGVAQIIKAKETWKNKFIDSMIEIYDLKKEGFLFKEIAEKLELTKDQASNRYRKYLRDYCG